MNKNSFSNIMQQKSDAELKSILDDKENYTNEALQAVIWELEERKIIAKNQIVLKQNIANIAQQSEIKTKNIPLKNLYSKQAIKGFTIFFSTIFGVILLMSNLKKMNLQKERMQVLLDTFPQSV